MDSLCRLKKRWLQFWFLVRIVNDPQSVLGTIGPRYTMPIYDTVCSPIPRNLGRQKQLETGVGWSWGDSYWDLFQYAR